MILAPFSKNNKVYRYGYIPNIWKKNGVIRRYLFSRKPHHYHGLNGTLRVSKGATKGSGGVLVRMSLKLKPEVWIRADDHKHETLYFSYSTHLIYIVPKFGRIILILVK